MFGRPCGNVLPRVTPTGIAPVCEPDDSFTEVIGFVPLNEKWIEGRSPGHIAAMREFMKQMSAQLAKAAYLSHGVPRPCLSFERRGGDFVSDD